MAFYDLEEPGYLACVKSLPKTSYMLYKFDIGYLLIDQFFENKKH